MATLRQVTRESAPIVDPLGTEVVTASLERETEPETISEHVARTGKVPRQWPPPSAEVVERAALAPNAHVKPLPAERDTGGTPYNRVTGEPYKGKNPLRLLTAECEHGWDTVLGWAGYRQWLDHGRQVMRGESHTKVMTVVVVSDKKTGEAKTVPGKTRMVWHYSQTCELEASDGAA